MLDAVDIPGLHHLVNVITFSQQGNRPVPDQCSGSDLDGDQYFIYWHPGLVPGPGGEGSEPEHFKAPLQAARKPVIQVGTSVIRF